MRRPARNVNLQIFATGLNQRAIAKGRVKAIIRPALPAICRHSGCGGFVADGRAIRSAENPRNGDFRPHNLLAIRHSASWICWGCRNLLIYLAPDVHAALLGHFHYSMNPTVSAAGQFQIDRRVRPVCLLHWAAAARFTGGLTARSGKALHFLQQTRQFTPTSAIDSATHPMTCPPCRPEGPVGSVPCCSGARRLRC